MRIVTITLMLACLTAAIGAAGEGEVPGPALNSLGLSGMEAMSDAAGMRVRGSNVAMTGAIAAVSGVLFDPETKSFVNFGEADFAMTNADAMDAAALTVVGFAFDLQLSNTSGLVARAAGAKTGFGYAGANASAFVFPAALLPQQAP